MSLAQYVIICRGRIDVLSTTDPTSKIQYASACAAELVSHIEITATLPGERAKEISDLQHRMMAALETKRIKKAEADLMVAEMFTLLDALEDEVKLQT